MLQLVLFAGLLLLPFNATPFLLVWCYQKLLLLSEPEFLIIEAVEIVLVVMYISQSFVNEIDEQPVMVKVHHISVLSVKKNPRNCLASGNLMILVYMPFK